MVVEVVVEVVAVVVVVVVVVDYHLYSCRVLCSFSRVPQA